MSLDIFEWNSIFPSLFFLCSPLGVRVKGVRVCVRACAYVYSHVVSMGMGVYMDFCCHPVKTCPGHAGVSSSATP